MKITLGNLLNFSFCINKVITNKRLFWVLKNNNVELDLELPTTLWYFDIRVLNGILRIQTLFISI